MLRLTFKNVDQGDSILLEWQKGGENKIAIIDCKKAFRTNPVLDHLIANNCTRIDFLLLSHPHLDHLSGFNELLDYCIDKKISIGHFLHTANNTHDYWQAAGNSAEAKSAILELFQKMRVAREKLGMEFHTVQGGMKYNPFTIANDFYFEVLGPTTAELDKFVKVNSFPTPDEEEKGNHPSANWLSTLIKIYSKKDDWFILLTSDVYSDILLYYGIKKDNLKGKKLVLGQAPHHGSLVNHKTSFWKALTKDDRVPIVISVGKNFYNHPSEEVVKSFEKNGFKIYTTNPVGPFAPKISKLGKENIAGANVIGVYKPTKNNDYDGDKVFQIDVDGNVTKI